ncbi:MAG: DUF484 family protein [Pseudomonadota bacterium]
MTTSTTSAPDLKASILADPDVVLEDRDVMQALIDANQEPGVRKVVDLRGALVNRLEQRLDKLEHTHRSVIAAAYENLAGTSQLHKAVLMLLEQTLFVDFLRVLALETPDLVAVDCARVCIETDEADPGPMPGLDADLSESVIVVPLGGARAYFALSCDTDRSICLRPAVPEADAIFGDAAKWVQSEALVRLDLGDGRQGLLVFGAEDPQRFGPEHGTDLLAFFGGVVERSLRRWLATGV